MQQKLVSSQHPRMLKGYESKCIASRIISLPTLANSDDAKKGLRECKQTGRFPKFIPECFSLEKLFPLSSSKAWKSAEGSSRSALPEDLRGTGTTKVMFFAQSFHELPYLDCYFVDLQWLIGK